MQFFDNLLINKLLYSYLKADKTVDIIKIFNVHCTARLTISTQLFANSIKLKYMSINYVNQIERRSRLINSYLERSSHTKFIDKKFEMLLKNCRDMST